MLIIIIIIFVEIHSVRVVSDGVALSKPAGWCIIAGALITNSAIFLKLAHKNSATLQLKSMALNAFGTERERERDQLAIQILKIFHDK